MKKRSLKGTRVRILSGRFKGRETTVRRDDGNAIITVDIASPFGHRPYWRIDRDSVAAIDAVTELGRLVP